MGRCIGSRVLCLSAVAESMLMREHKLTFHITLIFILPQQLKDAKFKSETNGAKIFNKFVWYVSQARNVLIVIITSCVAYQWAVGTAPFKLSGMNWGLDWVQRYK